MTKFLKQSLIRNISIITLVLIGAAIFVQLFATTSFQYKALSFTVNTKIGKPGGTIIAVPPVGQLFLKTHPLPWQLVITLNEIDLNKLEQQLNSLPPKEEWLTVFQEAIRQAFLFLFLKVIFWGLMGALFTLLFLRIYPPRKQFWVSLLTPLVLTSILVIGTAVSFNPNSLEQPRYQGVLASAPWAMNLITMGIENVTTIGDNLKKISQGLPLLYQQASKTRAMGDFQTNLTVLHVSDIHNNPAAFDFISQLIANFNVDLVIDTGDLTDYGTTLEARLLAKFKEITVPYLFIPGNHDSPLLLERLRRIKSVKVISQGQIQLKGLKIEAQADPAATRYNSDLASKRELLSAQKKLGQRIKNLKESPDLVAVHNRFLAADLIGKVPLVIHGHDHLYKLATEKGTVINDAGTTGAAGIRGLTKEGVPYSAAILYWSKDPTGKLKLRAIDSIKINGVEGELTINRNSFN